MSKLSALKPSKILCQLNQKSQLSNAVSRAALKQAIELWDDYKHTPNKHRSRDQLSAVADQLELIINQVTNGCTRINPTMWLTLTRLENNLREAAHNRIHLELNTKAANDAEITEVA